MQFVQSQKLKQLSESAVRKICADEFELSPDGTKGTLIRRILAHCYGNLEDRVRQQRLEQAIARWTPTRPQASAQQTTLFSIPPGSAPVQQAPAQETPPATPAITTDTLPARQGQRTRDAFKTPSKAGSVSRRQSSLDSFVTPSPASGNQARPSVNVFTDPAPGSHASPLARLSTDPASGSYASPLARLPTIPAPDFHASPLARLPTPPPTAARKPLAPRSPNPVAGAKRTFREAIAEDDDEVQDTPSAIRQKTPTPPEDDTIAPAGWDENSLFVKRVKTYVDDIWHNRRAHCQGHQEMTNLHSRQEFLKNFLRFITPSCRDVLNRIDINISDLFGAGESRNFDLCTESGVYLCILRPKDEMQLCRVYIGSAQGLRGFSQRIGRQWLNENYRRSEAGQTALLNRLIESGDFEVEFRVLVVVSTDYKADKEHIQWLVKMMETTLMTLFWTFTSSKIEGHHLVELSKCPLWSANQAVDLAAMSAFVKARGFEGVNRSIPRWEADTCSKLSTILEGYEKAIVFLPSGIPILYMGNYADKRYRLVFQPELADAIVKYNVKIIQIRAEIAPGHTIHPHQWAQLPVNPSGRVAPEYEQAASFAIEATIRIAKPQLGDDGTRSFWLDGSMSNPGTGPVNLLARNMMARAMLAQSLIEFCEKRLELPAPANRFVIESGSDNGAKKIWLSTGPEQFKTWFKEGDREQWIFENGCPHCLDKNFTNIVESPATAVVWLKKYHLPKRLNTCARALMTQAGLSQEDQDALTFSCSFCHARFFGKYGATLHISQHRRCRDNNAYGVQG